MRLASGALAAALCLAGAAGAGCTGSEPVLDLGSAREVALTLTFREDVAWNGARPSKMLRLSLRGGVQGDGASPVLRTTVRWAELTYVAADGTRMELASDGTRADPEGGRSLAAARRAVLEGLLGRDVALHFDPGPVSEGGGLASISGLLDALHAARDVAEGSLDLDASVVAQAAEGLEPLLDEAAAAEMLAGAGLGPAPGVVRSQQALLQRRVSVRVTGRGTTGCVLVGSLGEGRGEAPTVHLEGRLAAEAEFDGEPGARPPAAVGDVRVEGVRVVAETEYDPDSLRPQRGSLLVELPHAQGALVTRAAEFLLVVVRR